MADHWQVIEDALKFSRRERCVKAAVTELGMLYPKTDYELRYDIDAALAFVREQQLAERTPQGKEGGDGE